MSQITQLLGTKVDYETNIDVQHLLSELEIGIREAAEGNLLVNRGGISG